MIKITQLRSQDIRLVTNYITRRLNWSSQLVVQALKKSVVMSTSTSTGQGKWLTRGYAKENSGSTNGG